MSDESISRSSRPELVALYGKYRNCRDCDLHAFRRRTIEGIGNDRAHVVFVLDRLSVQDIHARELTSKSPYLQILWGLITNLGYDPAKFWYTAPTACPTVSLTGQERDVETSPLAKPAELKACRPRLHAELGIVEPEVIVACGATAARGVFLRGAPSMQYDLGRVVEAIVVGEYGNYPIPAMVVHSMHALYANDDMSDGGPWHLTHKALAVAMQLGDTLGKQRSD